MDRFYVDFINNNTGDITDEDEIKHITKVMRMKIGDKFELFDSSSNEYIAQISSIEKKRVSFDIIEKINIERELKTEISLYQGIPKQQKMEFIIQKATELGATKVIPCNFSRCVSDIKDKEEKKIERWQKIAYEATKQCKRTKILEVTHSKKIDNLLDELKNNDINIVFYENENNLSLKSLIKSITSTPKKIGLIVGPEGGFEMDEIEKFKSVNCHIVTLGNRILRTETAGLYGISVINYEFE